jgi:lysozyme
MEQPLGGPLRTSQEGLELIMGFEGFRPRASRLQDGQWLIGYGHTLTARAGLAISRFDAQLLLQFADLPPVEAMLQEQVLAPLTQNEFDALVSFAWNISPGAFRNSGVLACLNQGDRLGAAADMWQWRKGLMGSEVRVIDALVRRRAAEIALFLNHPAGPSPVPGALVRPMPDESLARRPAGPPLPPEAPVIIEARLPPSRPGPARSDPYPGGAPPILSPPVLSPPVAAARAVSERLARILGEAGEVPGLPGPADPATGLSVEEITRAIADLAGPADPGAQASPPRGPPDGIERRRGPRAPDSQPASGTGATLPEPHAPEAAAPQRGALAPDVDQPLPLADAGMVDDLAPPAIDPASISRAIRENGRGHPRRNAARRLGRWLPFALLSGLGLAGLFAGVQRFIARAATVPVSEADAWPGPLLALGGGFLFVVATYYLYQALADED